MPALLAPIFRTVQAYTVPLKSSNHNYLAEWLPRSHTLADFHKDREVNIA